MQTLGYLEPRSLLRSLARSPWSSRFASRGVQHAGPDTERPDTGLADAELVSEVVREPRSDSVIYATAYIAGRLASAPPFTGIYDLQADAFVRISGEVTPRQLSLYDYDSCNYIYGSGGAGTFSLFHTDHDVRLLLMRTRADQFFGCIYAGCAEDHRVEFIVTVSSRTVRFSMGSREQLFRV